MNIHLLFYEIGHYVFNMIKLSIMNHIVFCINDNWSMPATVLIESIIYYNNQSNFTFHIISNNISNKSKETFTKLQNNNPNITINFYTIDNSLFDSFPIRKNDHVTIETYYRFLIPSLLDESISKVLYLDCDILCTGNVDELFNQDLTNYACGMSPDTRFSDVETYNRLDYPYENGYFCAGVILLNLDYWRKHNIQTQCIEYLANNGNLCLWHDQDAINKVLNGKILYLKPKYDLLQSFYSVITYNKSLFTKDNIHNLYIKKSLWNDLLEAINEPTFIHFSGKVKPWHKAYYIKPFETLWKLFFYKSIWPSKKLIKNPRGIKGKLRIFIKILLNKTKKRIFPEEVYCVEQQLINIYKQKDIK